MKKSLLLVVALCIVPVAAAHAAYFDAASTKLLSAAGAGSLAEVQQALDQGADPNAVDPVGRTALMTAAYSNPDPAVVKALIKAGARVNERGPRSWTALMLAAYNNPSPDVVLTLLAAGANARLRSDAGETALTYAQDNQSLVGTAALRALRKALTGK